LFYTKTQLLVAKTGILMPYGFQLDWLFEKYRRHRPRRIGSVWPAQEAEDRSRLIKKRDRISERTPHGGLSVCTVRQPSALAWKSFIIN